MKRVAVSPVGVNSYNSRSKHRHALGPNVGGAALLVPNLTGSSSGGRVNAAGGITFGGGGAEESFSMCGISVSGPFGPWSDEDKKDAVIVEELNSMTLNDREKLFEEIHGVADTFRETDKILESKLESMETAVKWIKEKEAYSVAQFLSPSYVQDRALRIAILRASDYDPVHAARRIIRHFEFKMKLLGIDKLVKPITQSNLPPKMISDIRNGFVQILPKKDRSGRTIIFIDTKNLPIDDWRNFYGSMLYAYTIAIRDEDAQRLGVVFVLWMFDYEGKQKNYPVIARKNREFELALPARASVLHICYDNPVARPVLSIMHLSVNRNHRLRMRSHYGSQTECIYKLMSYGITGEMLPLNDELEVDSKPGIERFKAEGEREAIEEAAMPTVTIPSSRCVVVGKGYPFQNFIGNIFLSELVERNREQYALMPRSKKIVLTRGVMQYIVKVRGGQFLKRDDTLTKWIAADEKEVREKISFAFRGPKRRGVEYSHKSVEYSLEDGYSLLVPPPIRLEEWEKKLYS